MISNVGLKLDLLRAARTAEHTTLFGHSVRKCETVSGLLQVTQRPSACLPIHCAEIVGHL